LRRLSALACTLACVLMMAVGLLAAVPKPAGANNSPDAALARLLDDARTAAATPGTCTKPGMDRLVRIYCTHWMRIGVRDDYPLFSTHSGTTRQGYEVDVAQAVAEKLGVDIGFTKVNAAIRIPMLADDGIDVVIATMGHNTQRESLSRFIRPHYYRSQTILVGPRELPISDWNGISGLTGSA
jgi:polar amino acid transport system substrate-binding protein